MREIIELGSYKLDVSKHDRVATDANHENMSLFIVLEVLRFVILALLTFSLRGLWEDALFLLRAPLPPPRKFLIIFCVDSDTCFDRMSRTPICAGLSAISVMIFPPVRNASRPRYLIPLQSTGRTVLHRPWRKLPIPCPR